jgi:hypothetical protein
MSTTQAASVQDPLQDPAGSGLPAVPARLRGLERVDLQAPVFISDLHLSAQRPLTLGRFHAFLETLAAPVAELVILGDLFEFWAGDDALGGDEPDDHVGVGVADSLSS